MVVIGAEIPTYPEVARRSGIEGVVNLRLSTRDGEIIDINADSPSPALADAAAANVRTWQVTAIGSAVVRVRFVYELTPKCLIDRAGDPVVVATFPSEVHVKASPAGCSSGDQNVRDVRSPSLINHDLQALHGGVLRRPPWRAWRTWRNSSGFPGPACAAGHSAVEAAC
jgi:hypothetical protein